ncbi:MAG: hypothetical protein EXR72_21465 [Myxococcales bacterium]|nr:hypothetical protein [Myxococcales bacterium]
MVHFNRPSGLLALFLLLSGACGEKAKDPPVDAGCPAGQTACGGACTNTLTDEQHCGACDAACGEGQFCTKGICATTCPKGQIVCGAAGVVECVSPMGDVNHCGGCDKACAAGQSCQKGACTCPASAPDACGAGAGVFCTKLQIDPTNCGKCGTDCGVGLLCQSGACKGGCSKDFIACPPMMPTYCANLASDGANCGACGQACPVGQQCMAGTCHCPAMTPGACGQGANAFCTNHQVDANNCGACGQACAVGQQCAAGKCTCPLATPNGCGLGMNAFCTHFQTDAANCGGCGSKCADGQVCQTGKCQNQCAQGLAACPVQNPMYCANLGSDGNNCGACGTTCAIGQQCGGGKCACPALTPDACGMGMGAFCTNTKADTSNCGACAASCMPNQTCIAGACTTPKQTMTLLAGSAGSFGNIDGTGTAARFQYPIGVAFDGTGNLYVADTSNSVIRKVVLATAVTTTFAGGMGVAGFTDGPPGVARFNSPYSLACDGKNLYVADVSNHAIRQIVLANGAVSTLAGGGAGYSDAVGVAARFSSPQGIALDGSTLYVADVNNRVVRAINLMTGGVTTLAGGVGQSGSIDGLGANARFSNIQGLAADGAGNLFVSDTGNHTIRQIVIANASVSTFAGLAGNAGIQNGIGAAARFRNPIGLVVENKDTLYVADTGNHTIRQINLPMANVTTVAGSAPNANYADGTGGAALFNSPTYLDVDGKGNLFVADQSNHAIRKVVVMSGAVTTFAGLGASFGAADGVGAAARFNNPAGMASDGKDTLFVSDNNNQTIRKITISSKSTVTLSGTVNTAGNLDGPANLARYYGPNGLALDGSGNLYVADTNNHTIRKIKVADGSVITLAGTPGTPGGMDGAGMNATFSSPQAVAFDGQGALYVADTNGRTIRKIVLANATVSTIAGLFNQSAVSDGVGQNARFGTPIGVASDGGDGLYVTDSNRIRKVSVGSGTVTTLSGGGGYSDGQGFFANFNGPRQLAIDGAGNLFIADFNNNLVRRMATGSASVTTVCGEFGRMGLIPGPLPTAIVQPRAAVPLAGGFAFVANYGVFLVQ